MKKILVILAGVVFAAGGAWAQRIKGSDTCLPLSQAEAEAYMKAHPGARVTVTGGGSGVGIAALVEGTADIAQSSRKIKFDESKKLQSKGLTETIVAYDALAIVVHPSNPVTKLTRQQLEDIFTGKVTNWKQLGGPDMKIIPYSRETSSGTYEFFRESVLRNRNYTPGILSMPATGAIVQSISQTRGGIGYIGLAYLNKSIKALQISYSGTHVAPSVATAKNGSYPIVRKLYYYHTAPSAKPFIDFVTSPAGQKIVEQTGFITL